MKEWILENTTVTSDGYDELINSDGKNRQISDNTKKQILAIIDEFTLNPTSTNGSKLGIEKYKDGYIFNGIIFDLFSDINKDPRLLRRDRYHQCHIASFALALGLNSSIVTAKVIDWFDNSFLHTFILSEENDLVIDYSFNIMMRKSDYYNLLDVTEVVKIDYPELVEYRELLFSCNAVVGNIDYKEIVTFPTEIKEAILKLEKRKK